MLLAQWPSSIPSNSVTTSAPVPTRPVERKRGDAATEEAPAPRDARDRTRGEPPQEPFSASPDVIENLILDTLAQLRPSVLSINSVTCDGTTCQIGLSGNDVNPERVGPRESEITTALFRAQSGFRILTAGASTREIAPGAREYVVGFTYQPLIDLSHDPKVAARQHAECAAAWRRQAANPTPEKYRLEYLANAEQHLAIAAAELGREEAERIAAGTELGPVARGCAPP
jgi:hypothetical protein